MLDLCIVNSWLLYRATSTIADCSTPLAELKLDVAIELIKKRERDDEYLPSVHGVKVHSAQNVNRIPRHDLVVDNFPRKLQNSKNLQRCKYEECKRK